MNCSKFSNEEPPPRKWETLDPRNVASCSGHVTGTDSHPRNCRDACHGNHTTCSAGSFRDRLPNIHDIRNEAAYYGADRVQRTLAFGCSGQKSELFRDHDHHPGMNNNRFYNGMPGSSTPVSSHAGHQQNVCDRGCCGSVDMRRENSGLANCSGDGTRPTSRSSMYVDSFEFHRNAAAVGSMPHCPSTPREVETRSASQHAGSMANSGMRTKGACNQVMLYGWFLMSPPRESDTKDPPPRFSVAIGGYRCPKMEEQDFYATATVVERLERWKLRTSDGLEVGLMGIIDTEKSVANGFSLSVVQCFMIGFPSAWVYMLLSLQKCGRKGSSSGMQSLSASPANSAGTPGVVGNNTRDCLESPEANVVQTILQSPLFTAARDIKIRMASSQRRSTAATTPSHEGVVSDADSIPQSHLGHEQVDGPKGGDRACDQADLPSQKPAPLSDERTSRREQSPCTAEDVPARDPSEMPQSSSQTQAQAKLNGVTSGSVGDEREVSPSSIGKENRADEAQEQTCNAGAGTCDNDQEVEPASVAPEDIPFTPQIQTRKRLRSDTSTSAENASPIEPDVGVAKPRCRRKLRSDSAAEVEQATVEHANPVGAVKRSSRSKPRGESPAADVPVGEPVSVSGAEPVIASKTRDGRKRPRKQPQSPVSNDALVEPVTDTVNNFRSSDSHVKGTDSDADPIVAVKRRGRRKLRSKSPVADTPALDPITISVAEPVSASKTRDTRKRLRNKPPVSDDPLVEQVAEPVYNFRRNDSHVGGTPGVPGAGPGERPEAGLSEELQEADIVMKREELDVAFSQCCDGKNAVKGQGRKKRHKIRRNYYQRGKKKFSLKRAQAYEKVSQRFENSTGTRKISTEDSKCESDESQGVQEKTEPLEENLVQEMKEKVGRSNTPTRRKTSNPASCIEVPECSAEDSHVKRNGRSKTFIVPPPLPSPRVADKSKVTEAFGLKTSLHGRVLVPPLANWRSQSIQYDQDGSIIAICDGFEGSKDENCTGYYNFKPPGDKASQTMRRRLCKAADKGSRKR